MAVAIMRRALAATRSTVSGPSTCLRNPLVPLGRYRKLASKHAFLCEWYCDAEYRALNPSVGYLVLLLLGTLWLLFRLYRSFPSIVLRPTVCSLLPKRRDGG